MDIGVFANVFQRDRASTLFESIHESGFQTIHFNFNCLGLDPLPDEVSDEIIDAINGGLTQSSLDMASLSGTFNMIHPDKNKRESDFEKFCELVDISQHLETWFITLCTGTRDPHDKWKYHPDNSSKKAWMDLTDMLERVLELAEEYSIYMGIEPETGNVVNSIDSASRLISQMQSPFLKIILDVANLFEKANLKEIKYLIDKGLDVLTPDLQIIHIKDKDRNGQFVTPGQGIIPFDYLVEKLDSHGYTGPLIAHGFREKDAKEVSGFLKKLVSR